MSSKPDQGAQDVASTFDGLENPAGGLPGPAMGGGPYTVKGGSWSLFHAVKTAWHAHDRMKERTEFHHSYVDQLQRAVDTLPLTGNAYHLPLRSKDGSIAGYAQFKRVPNRERPVLATVLAPHMTPGGQNIEEMIGLQKKSHGPETNDSAGESGAFDTDHLDPRPPQSSAWNRRHQHGFAPETQAYALRKAFDGVLTQPKNEVIESGDVPSQVTDMR